MPGEDDLAREWVEAGQRLGKRRFAGAGFTDDAENFAGLHREADGARPGDVLLLAAKQAGE